MVLRVDDAFAYVADGDLRKAEQPKKKKHRHLRPTQVFYPELAQALAGGRTPSNAELRKYLADQTERLTPREEIQFGQE